MYLCMEDTCFGNGCLGSRALAFKRFWIEGGIGCENCGLGLPAVRINGSGLQV